MRKKKKLYNLLSFKDIYVRARSFRFPFPPPRRRGGCCSLLREREEEKEGEFFLLGVVGFDREVRRYLFHSCASEIEFE